MVSAGFCLVLGEVAKPQKLEYADVLAGKRGESNRLYQGVEEASSLWPAAGCRFHLLRLRSTHSKTLRLCEK
jgi:hypothetical protein